MTRSRHTIALSTLILCLMGLLAAFLISLNIANAYFERAAAAQAQLAAVSQIEAQVAWGRPNAQLAKSLRDYRASVEQEMRFLRTDAERSKQRQEAQRAGRLAALAAIPGDRVALEKLVAAIAREERGEVAAVAHAMTRLLVRTTILAILLAVAALGATLAGMGAFYSANRRLVREVEARTANLRAVDQSRRLFFAKASHELRTPITVMRGEAEVSLADPRADVPDLCEALRHVVANAEFLNRRVEELLGLSKAEDGRLSLAPSSTDLSDLLRATVTAAEGYARSADVQIDVTVPHDAPRIAADARWLGQALLAVIDNGVKFSPQGGVLRLSMDRADAGARIAIVDTGPGVMAEALPRIFDAYYQTEAGQMRGGTGLGLALARWVVEQHGGTIAAANEPGGGCRIDIILPMEKAA
jgi:signal transduction histidine kinase